jgi:predicted CXXCH cytochrome family protein
MNFTKKSDLKIVMREMRFLSFSMINKAFWVKAMRQFLLAFCLLTIYVTGAYAGISGSKHDFSGKGWGSNEICIFCHTPHNANKTVSGSQLWNHALTNATYILYSSPTLKKWPGDPDPTQPTGPSKLCLSCHDGTVAVDSFGSRSGTQLISGRANIGTDLSNDHPVSIRWNHQTVEWGLCDNCHVGGGSYTLRVSFYGSHGSQTVECGTCHEPHNNSPPGTGKMLRISMNRSELCLYCHEK